MVGGGASHQIISLSFKGIGNDKNVFERDGIFKDKNNPQPFFISVTLLFFSLLLCVVCFVTM